MDLYLPADFHALHDAAPDDWRDLSASCAPRHEGAAREPSGAGRRDGQDPDPLWRVV